MNRLILVDGNNLLFRSYYATAYNGNFMKNSKGFPTNALFGFTNMINKIISEEKPTYMLVAFDKGKTFRHDQYKEYKEGRIETPEELKLQFPIAKELLTAMGIKYFEIDNYEADDIIGTFAKYCDLEPDFVGTVISSDRDLLQLISTDVEMKLLKQKDYVRYSKDSFIKEYNIDPENVVDLKSLQGDTSDNIPGVRGIGEKTALKLIQDYKTLDNLYAHIDNISGKLKEKLIEDKENAYLSHQLATIIKDVPLEINISDVKYLGPNDKLNPLYEELEFYSFLKKTEKVIKEEIEVNIISDIKDVKIDGNCAVYLEILGTNYHTSEILGLGVYNNNTNFFIPFDILKEKPELLVKNIKYTYDLKKLYVALKWANINIGNVIFDTMLAANILEYNVKDDISYLAKECGEDIPFYETIYGKNKLVKPSMDIIAKNAVNKARFIYDTYQTFYTKLVDEKQFELFNNIELPLSIVLGNMEYTGVCVDSFVLKDMGEDIDIKIELLSKDIYNLAGEEFNIASPQQLGIILFEKIGLPSPNKKGVNGYSTAIDVLLKLKGKHAIIDHIMEYRNLTKLRSTYIEGLLSSITPDNKIHTIYNQVIARTGRLSSIEPNLQNIPIRSEYGKMIRKAFIPSPGNLILSGDYSQIELRVLAHIANIPSLIKAFNEGIDIHTKTASDIFHVDLDLVTKDMRRMAKAVNFGIIYGISSFGLSENLDISMSEAKKFIDNYLETYPGIKRYMDDVVKQAYVDGYVTTLFNRKRKLEELKNTNYMIRQQGERMALNTPIQGTSADIIKKAMVDMYAAFYKANLKSKMILQVHDELVFDCVEGELEKVIEIVTQVMENTYELNVPLRVDIEYGKNWYQVK